MIPSYWDAGLVTIFKSKNRVTAMSPHATIQKTPAKLMPRPFFAIASYRSWFPALPYRAAGSQWQGSPADWARAALPLARLELRHFVVGAGWSWMGMPADRVADAVVTLDGVLVVAAMAAVALAKISPATAAIIKLRIGSSGLDLPRYQPE